MKASERVPLGDTGVLVSRLGVGTGPMGAEHSEAVWAENVDAAWELGVRSFDTAAYYGFGNSEKQLGRQLAKRPRDEFSLTTKVGRLLRHGGPRDRFADAFYYPDGVVPDDVPSAIYDYSHDAAITSLKESMERLGVERLDIVHIHDIIEMASGINHKDEALAGAFPALQELREQGLLRAIGAGVQDNELLVELAGAAPFDCFLLAGRYTLLDQASLDAALPICEEKGISIIVGSPYNTGILHDPTDDASFDFAPAPRHLIEKARAIKAVCERHAVPLPAAAMQFPFAHPSVVQVLTGAVTAAEIEENIRLMEHPIPAELWDALREAELLDPRAPVPGEALEGAQ
jgi:D-threo-aldose 1-dehydrogenase